VAPKIPAEHAQKSPADDAVRRARLAIEAERMSEHRPRMNDAAITAAVSQLTPDGAKQLDAKVRTHPYDSDELEELIRYYQAKRNLAALKALTAAFIERHAEVRRGWGMRAPWNHAWDREGYERGRTLWLARLQQPIDSWYVYMNAADFLAENDKEQAEQALLEGQRKYPLPELHWEVLRGRLYAWTLTGLPGEMPDHPSPALSRAPDFPLSQTAYAQKIRAMLLASNDSELLSRTVEGSAFNRPFAQSLVERILKIDPQNRSAHLQRYELRAQSVISKAGPDGRDLSETERMVWIERRLYWWRNLANSDIPDAEKLAHELISLATRNSGDQDAGTAIFTANLTLAEFSMSAGNSKLASEQLLQAAGAPVTDYMRYMQIDLSMAQWLLDAGQRDAVAQFLDQCAGFNWFKQLAKWGKQIREGKDPALSPAWRIRV
jgi:hypothetical protein